MFWKPPKSSTMEYFLFVQIPANEEMPDNAALVLAERVVLEFHRSLLF
jgi:hypothetical protein